METEAPVVENDPNPPLVVEAAEAAGAVPAPPNIEAAVELKNNGFNMI